jgi:hypothetical protein
MARRTRWILLALLVLVVGGAIALVVVQRPKLDDAGTRVDTTWKPLRGPDQLVLRYQTLTSALTAFDAAGGKDRAVSKDLGAALAAWQRSLRDGDAGAQAEAANRLEAQGMRLASNALGSQRIRADRAVTDSLTKFAQTQPNPAFVSAYNRAVRAYEDQRTETLAKPVARVLGFDARPVLQLGVGAEAGS